MLEKLTQQLTATCPLADEQVLLAVEQLTDEKIPAAVKAAFLAALAQKGETPEEIAAFARALRDKSIQPPLDAETRTREILDVVGTGGDRLSTFNISTTVAILCAAAGVTVAKHGNRAVTSSVGSADVVEELGLKVDLSPAEAARSLREHNFAFFFAPTFHPAFKNIAPARKLCAERGQRTIFNILGPLLNPARPSASAGRRAAPGTVRAAGARAAVARRPAWHGRLRSWPSGKYLDELSTLGANHVAEFYQERGLAVSSLSPENFPLQAGGAGRFARRRQIGERGNHPPHFSRRRARPKARRGFAQRRRRAVRRGQSKIACRRVGFGSGND